MASRKRVLLIRESVDAWNAWRRSEPNRRPNLASADLHDLKLHGANLARANLESAELSGADLTGADLGGANLFGARLEGARLDGAMLAETTLDAANLTGASLRRADLTGASAFFTVMTNVDLTGADLTCAYLEKADLKGAVLTDANLRKAVLRETQLSGAALIGCNVYGIACWDIQLSGAIQQDLCVSPEGTPAVVVDNIELAQFIYLLMNNSNLRGVIDTITSKAVLILGRFTPERKQVLDAIHEALREEHGLVPIMFDFEPSANRNLTETVQLLAGMCRFVIADITDAASIPQELSKIVPNFPSVPVQPIILASKRPYAMFADWRQFPNMLPEYAYPDQTRLLASLETSVIAPVRVWERETDKSAARERLMREEISHQRAEIDRLKALLEDRTRHDER